MRVIAFLTLVASALELSASSTEGRAESKTAFNIRARLRRHRLHRFHLGRHQHAHYFIPQHSPPCRHLPPEKRGPCELEFDKEEVKKWSAGERKGKITTVQLQVDG